MVRYYHSCQKRIPTIGLSTVLRVMLILGRLITSDLKVMERGIVELHLKLEIDT